MTPPRVLVAGIGNIFLGDDGFGSEVAQRLLPRRWPEGVHVVDIGIRGMDLAYLLLDAYDTLVLVDTIARGAAPGTLSLIEVDAPDAAGGKGAEAGRAGVETHSLDPAKVLAFARALGAPPIRTLLVGCEPARLGGEGDDELSMGLSDPVRAALDEAVRLVERLITELRAAPARANTSPVQASG